MSYSQAVSEKETKRGRREREMRGEKKNARGGRGWSRRGAELHDVEKIKKGETQNNQDVKDSEQRSQK